MPAPALLWIVTCAVLILDLILANTTKTNIILRDVVDSIDTRKFNFECAFDNMNGDLTEVEYEDIHLNVTQLITKYNYPVEEHYVTTEDGYILTVIRMPNNGPPIYLMHGFVSSADDFVTMNLPNSMAYNLWEKGFEIWIGNARGNKYSRRHLTLNPDTDKEFWDFSWDEIGRIDITNTIDYILEKTGRSQIMYIGHSQGTTAFFVMCSERPEYNDKIALMISLSSVVYMTHLKSPVVRLLAPFNNNIEFISQLIGYNEMQPSDLFIRTFTRIFCSDPRLAFLVCANILSIFFGFNCAQADLKNIPVIYGHIPSGSATKQLIHYLQEVMSGKFQRYDHGPLKNLKVYGTIVPPEYDVEKITCPIANFYCDNDWVSDFTDVQRLLKKLPNVVNVYRVPFAKFSHMDYLFAKDWKTLVYPKMLELVMTYSRKMSR